MTMDVLAAARCVARDFKGGARALGELMGKSNLSDELNPNVKTAKLGAADMVEMEIWADDYRPLYAHCAATRHFPPVKMPDPLAHGEMPCMRTLSEMVKESADVVSTTVEALADDEVSDNDLARFDKESSELIVKLQQLREQMAAKNARAKARAA
jgi:hypothetical protein